MINQNSELKIMRALVKNWFREFSVYELAKESAVSIPMAYKTVKSFLAQKIITENKRKIKADFNSLFTYNFKLLYDSERLNQLSDDIQEKIDNIFNVIKAEYLYDLLGFIVFGSVASNEMTEKSDIDFLVIIKEKKEINYKKSGLLNLEKINIVEKTKSEFESEYLLAYDLILNALMNGIIIFDEGIIRFLLKKPLPEPSYEVIMQKKQRLDILKNRLFILLKDKDYKELVEQFKLYLIEQARILLLQKGLIPSSKKYIINSLKKTNKNLYKFYTSVNTGNVAEFIKNV